MLNSARYRELRCGNRYNTHTECELSENGTIEENVTVTSLENVQKKSPGFIP